MQLLTKMTLLDLMSERAGPCLSLYQRTHRHHPDNAQDPIRFGNLVKQLEQSLRQRSEEGFRAGLLQPFYRLQNDPDFWNHTLDGLVVLSAPGESHVFPLHRSVVDFAVVADTWHIKPLLRVQQTADSFQVLCVTREWIRLYEGNRDVLDEVDLVESVPRTINDALGEELTEPYQKVSSYGMGPAGGPGKDMRHGHGDKKDELDNDIERFFRAIDRAIFEQYSRPSELPLLLVALPEYQGIFRKLTHNPFLLKEGISTDPGALSVEQLNEKAWATVEPAYQRSIDGLVSEFQEASAKGLGSKQLDETLNAAIAGRVSKVLVDAEHHIPGQLDFDSMTIRYKDDFVDPAIGDVLDDMAALVLRQGGKVLVIPSSQMPTRSGIATIYRY